MKIKFLFPIAAALGAFAVASFGADSTFNSTDKSFIEDAYKDGLAEVSFGQLALGKTANADVKAFAQKLVDDHSKANAELKSTGRFQEGHGRQRALVCREGQVQDG